MDSKEYIKKIIHLSKQIHSIPKRVDFLHNKFAGMECYILGCGPSLNSADKSLLLEETKDKCLITIKQSYFSFTENVDFQVFNTNNFVTYPYRKDTFFWGSLDGRNIESALQQIWKGQKLDAFSTVHFSEPLTKRQEKGDLNLDEFTFSKDYYNRNWGCGIMFEVVLFLAFHLGFSNIKTVGWDYMPKGTQREIAHFYPEIDRSNLINPAGLPLQEENDQSIRLSSVFHKWFKEKDITLMAFDSKECHLPSTIERFKL